MFALKLTERAAHGDTRYAMRLRQIIFIGKASAEHHGATHDAIAQHKIDLARLGFLQSIRHTNPCRNSAGPR